MKKEEIQLKIKEKKYVIEKIEESINNISVVTDLVKIDTSIEKKHYKRVIDGKKSLNILLYKENVELRQLISQFKEEIIKRENYEEEKTNRVLKEYGLA